MAESNTLSALCRGSAVSFSRVQGVKQVAGYSETKTATSILLVNEENYQSNDM